MNVRAKIGCLWLSSTLMACSSIQQPMPSASAWRANVEQIAFEASGRLSAKSTQDGAMFASFDWQQNQYIQNIDINLPLGLTVGRLCSDQDGVVLMNHQGMKLQAKSLNDLRFKVAGIRLPNEQHLRHWVQGAWSPDLPYRLLADGSLQQGDWVIQRQIDEHQQIKQLRISTQNAVLQLIFDDFVPLSNNDVPNNCTEWLARD